MRNDKKRLKLQTALEKLGDLSGLLCGVQMRPEGAQYGLVCGPEYFSEKSVVFSI